MSGKSWKAYVTVQEHTGEKSQERSGLFTLHDTATAHKII